MSTTSPCPQCGIQSRFREQKLESEDGKRLTVIIECEHCHNTEVIRSGPKDLVELEIDVEQLRAKHEVTGLLGDVLAAREHRLNELRHYHADPG